MGIVTDILKEFPLSAIFRERLVDMEKENALLKAENAVLKTKNAELETKLQNIERDKTIHGDVCPYCQQSTGKVIDIKPHPVVWEAGIKVHYYECQGCGKKYDRQKDS